MTVELHQHTHAHMKNQVKFDALHEKKYVRTLDKYVLVISILSPLFTLDQVWKIYSTKVVTGLSLLTWCAWLIFGVFWLLYGLAHRSKPIIVNYVIWLFIYSLVITGILIYR